MQVQLRSTTTAEENGRKEGKIEGKIEGGHKGTVRAPSEGRII